MLRISLFSSTFIVFLSALTALAQTVPSTVEPGREAEQFSTFRPPLSQPAAGAIQLFGESAPEGADTLTLTVKSIEVQGDTVLGSSAIEAVTRDLAGKSVTVQQIYEVAANLTTLYGDSGYVFSRVIVPPQELDPAGAIIQLQAVEGYVDQVVWPENLRASKARLVSDYTAKITAERPANIRTIERYLLLANDLPGTTLRSKFEASPANPGATTLTVEMDHDPYQFAGQIDNRGSDGRGPWQYLSNVQINDALGFGERFGLTYAGAFQTKELQYIAASLDIPLTAEGLTSFIRASYSNGDPGIASLRQLGYTGESVSFETGLSYPVIRSRDENLIFSGSFFLNDSRGETDTSTISRDRLRGIRLSADYDRADEFGGISQIGFTFSQGIEGLGSTETGDAFASRNNGRPDFTSVQLNLSRIQDLGAGFSLLGNATGAYAFTPLLASEQCSYGGRTIGRGFDPSELTGDHCLGALLEVRYDLSNLPEPVSSAQLYGFADAGAVFRIDPAAGEDSRESGSSAGFGVRTGWSETVNLDASLAKPLAGRDDEDWRFFLALNTRF